MALQKAREESIAGSCQELWARVEIYTTTCSCSGNLYCPRSRRILDVLNNVGLGLPGDESGFLMVREARFYFSEGLVESAETAYLNERNILFVREIDGEHKGIGGNQGHRPYPYVDKLVRSVKLHTPLGTLCGRLRYSRVGQVRDELALKPRFIALTDVDILLPHEAKSLKAGFVAVNKRHILSVLESL